MDDQQPTQPSPPTDEPAHRRGPHLSRRRALALAGAGVVGVAGAGSLGGYAVGRTGERRRVQAVTAAAGTSTPATPPLFTTLVNQPGQAAGDIFLTDMGDTAATMIADGAGNSLWSSAGARSYANMRLQTYQGRPVITWWESHSTGLAAYADGQTVIEDVAHNVITRVQKHGDVSPDEHEFSITPRGTAYIVSYVKTKADLRPVKGPKDGLIMNGIFEEVDLATGEVLHHWESLDHVALTESHAGVPEDPTEPYDYFHINSVAPTPDGNVIISARHTWAVYKVDLATGAVRWRLGGRKSDFDLPSSATFAWQHDAQFETPTMIRMFDNGSDGTETVTDESQVLWFSVDEAARTARLVRRLVHPAKISAHAMGNAQRLDNGNLFVGWGTAQRISEFSDDGTLLFDATLPDVSYRAFRQVWR
ncbi:arylsulfotransferase family protein [Microlunatus antarcticus]